MRSNPPETSHRREVYNWSTAYEAAYREARESGESHREAHQYAQSEADSYDTGSRIRADVLPGEFSENPPRRHEDLPDTAFLYVGQGGVVDESGRTRPRELRKLPYQDARGQVRAELLEQALQDLAEDASIPDYERPQIRARIERLLGGRGMRRTQKQELEFAHRRIADKDEAFAHLSQGPHGLTRRELATLIEQHPERWGRYRGYLRDDSPLRENTMRPKRQTAHTPAYLDDDLLRDVRLEAETGKVFRLRLWDINHRDSMGKWVLAYRFEQVEPEAQAMVLFEGEDFAASPMDAVDSDETVRGLLVFLTLRPGDTDASYFEGYTEDQMDFANTDAEALSMYALEPGEDEEPMELEDWDGAEDEDDEEGEEDEDEDDEDED